MNLLVYVEPTDRSDWALAPALDLAQGLGLTVLLLTTEEGLAADPTLLDRATERLRAGGDVLVEHKVRRGPAREAILAESRASSPVIVIFPPAARGGIARMLRGSRVKAVVHNSPATVMVARKPVSEHIRRILVTVSGGPMSETTLLSAQEIAKAVHGELTVLHVKSGVTIPFGDAPGGARQDTDEPKPLDELLQAFAREGNEPKIRMRDGMVVREIIEECHQGSYDLLVLGQHLADAATGGPLSRNLAEILAVDCPIPVLVVRPGRWARAAESGEVR